MARAAALVAPDLVNLHYSRAQHSALRNGFGKVGVVADAKLVEEVRRRGPVHSRGRSIPQSSGPLRGTLPAPRIVSFGNSSRVILPSSALSTSMANHSKWANSVLATSSGL